MEDYQADIESLILPTFIDEKIKTDEWGEWVGKIVETSFVRVIINNKPYILIEDDNDGGFEEGNPSEWISEYMNKVYFSDEQKKQLGFIPRKALKSKKPLHFKLFRSDYISRLEADDGRFIDYMLFEK